MCFRSVDSGPVFAKASLSSVNRGQFGQEIHRQPELLQ